MTARADTLRASSCHQIRVCFRMRRQELANLAHQVRGREGLLDDADPWFKNSSGGDRVGRDQAVLCGHCALSAKNDWVPIKIRVSIAEV